MQIDTTRRSKTPKQGLGAHGTGNSGAATARLSPEALKTYILHLMLSCEESNLPQATRIAMMLDEQNYLTHIKLKQFVHTLSRKRHEATKWIMDCINEYREKKSSGNYPEAAASLVDALVMTNHEDWKTLFAPVPVPSLAEFNAELKRIRSTEELRDQFNSLHPDPIALKLVQGG